MKFTQAVSITISYECLLMVERDTSAKVLLLLLLKDVRYVAFSKMQNNMLPC